MNIIIADDHQMMTDGIRNMLSADPLYTVIAEANNGQVAYEMIAENPEAFQLLITDISMPLLNGTQLCRMVKGSFGHIQVLILSMYNNDTAIKEAIMAEADGYILKNAGKDDLLKALDRIMDGGTYFSQDIVPVIYRRYQQQKEQDQQLKQLSEREIEILDLIVKEYTSEEIARKLFISKTAVDDHRQHMLEKTACKSTVGLVKFAVRAGIV